MSQSLHKDAKLKNHRVAHASKSRSPFTSANPRSTPRPHSTGSTGSGRGSGRGARVDPTQLSAGLLVLQNGGPSAAAAASQATMCAGSANVYSSPQQQQQQQHNYSRGCDPELRSQQPYGSNISMALESAEAMAPSLSSHAHARSDSGHSSSSPLLAANAFSVPRRSSPLTASVGTPDHHHSNNGSFAAYASSQLGQQQMSASHSQTLYPSSQPAWPSNSIPVYNGSPSNAGSFQQQQQQQQSSSCGFSSVRAGSNLPLRPAASSSLTGTSPNANIASSMRRAPLLGPPPSQPTVGGRTATPRSPMLASPAQTPGGGGGNAAGQNYYYQHGGNTFIQDGKRHENEYYPPLPPNQPFRPASQAVAKLVPLPHPQAERGGIPAIFRFWGPAGQPNTRSSMLSRPGMPVPLAPTPQQQHLQQQQQAAQPSPLSSSAGSSRLIFQPGPVPPTPVAAAATAANIAGSPTPPMAMAASTTTPMITTTSAVPVAGNPDPAATVNNLVVRVRRRGVSTAAGAADTASGCAAATPCLIPTTVNVPVPSGASFSTPASTMAHGSSLNHAGPASFQATPIQHSEQRPHGMNMSSSSSGVAVPTANRSRTAATSAGIGSIGAGAAFASAGAPGDESDRSSRPLSPTSMLPSNLINEGSKTKGESVLRVDDDLYVQREAFRWNPYASTKWVTGKRDTDQTGK